MNSTAAGLSGGAGLSVTYGEARGLSQYGPMLSSYVTSPSAAPYAGSALYTPAPYAPYTPAMPKQPAKENAQVRHSKAFGHILVQRGNN